MLPRARYIAATFVLLFVCFLGIDVLLGRLVRAAQARAREQAEKAAAESERAYRVAHPLYHHDLKPGISAARTLWGPETYTVHTNSLGFRDAHARDIPLESASRRLLIIGDSFTEGVGVEFEQTVAGRLAQGYALRGVEVLNAGVASYSPAIYWTKVRYLLEEVGLDVDHVVVLLDISDIRDEAWTYRVDSGGRVVDGPGPPKRLLSSWLTNSLTYRGGAKALDVLFPFAPLLGCVIDDTRCMAGWTSSESVRRQYADEGLRRADGHMTRLASLLRGRGIPLTIVVYPWLHQLQWNDRDSMHVRLWREWAGRENVNFIELFSDFFAERDMRDARSVIAAYFIDGDVHWNDAGHQVVARSISRRVSIDATRGT